MLLLSCMISVILIFDVDCDFIGTDLKRKVIDEIEKSDASNYQNILKRNFERKQKLLSPLSKVDEYSTNTRLPEVEVVQIEPLKPRIKSILKQNDNWQLRKKVLNFYNLKQGLHDFETPSKFIGRIKKRNRYTLSDIIETPLDTIYTNNLKILTQAPNIFKKDFVPCKSKNSSEYLFNWKEVSIIAVASFLLSFSTIFICASLVDSSFCKKTRNKSEFKVDKWLANSSGSTLVFDFPKNEKQVSNKNESCKWSHINQKKNEKIACECSSTNSSTSVA